MTDIERKLSVLRDMWQSRDISYEVKASMARLATALHRRMCDAADQLHLSLMMDYVSEVSTYYVNYVLPWSNQLQNCLLESFL